MSSDRFVSRHCLLVGVLPRMLFFLLGGSDLHCTMAQTFWPVQNYQAQTHDSKDLTLSHFWIRNTYEVLESSISANLAKPSKQSRVKKYAVWLMSIINVIISVVSVVNDVIHNKKNEIWAKKSLKFSRDLIIMTLLTTLVTLVHEKILFQTIPVYSFAKIMTKIEKILLVKKVWNVYGLLPFRSSNFDNYDPTNNEPYHFIESGQFSVPTSIVNYMMSWWLVIRLFTFVICISSPYMLFN